MQIEEAALSFNRSAEDYNAIRPGYPAEMFEYIISRAGISNNSSILDIGSGTGQSVLPMLKKGYQITCLEPGKNLFELLQANTKVFKEIELINNTFEEYQFSEKFDLITAGTSFHWLDLKVSIPKIEQFLSNPGTLCVFWNKHPKPYTGFFAEVQKVYRDNFPTEGNQKSFKDLSSKKDNVLKQVRDSRIFKEELSWDHDWFINFTSAEYISLLNTFSDNILLPHLQREKLFSEIKELIDSKYEGMVTRPYRTELHLFNK